jgi:hypothetical protein
VSSVVTVEITGDQLVFGLVLRFTGRVLHLSLTGVASDVRYCIGSGLF